MNESVRKGEVILGPRITMSNDPTVRDEIAYVVEGVEPDGTIVARTREDLPMTGVPVTRDGSREDAGMVARIPPEDAAQYRREADGRALG